MPPLTESQARFLADARVARLATADADGQPQVIPVCFVFDGEVIYIVLDQKPKSVELTRLRRVRNILANPQAALVVDHYEEDWSRLAWMMLRGRAEILHEGREHDRAQELLRARYPQYRDMALAALPVIAIRVARVASWGNLDAFLPARKGDGR